MPDSTRSTHSSVEVRSGRLGARSAGSSIVSVSWFTAAANEQQQGQRAGAR